MARRSGDLFAGQPAAPARLPDIRGAEAERDAAWAAYQPYKEAFDEATFALQALHQRRAAGEAIGKPTVLAAFDRRLQAGHAGYPFKRRAEAAGRWVKELWKELGEG